MRLFLIAITLLFTASAFGQSEAEKLNEKAFSYYLYDKNTDSALWYYQLLQQRFPDFRPAYINNVMGNCYLKRGDKESAKHHLLLSLKNPDPSDLYPERTCTTLGDLLLEEKDYAAALAYYDSSTSRYRIRVPRMSAHRFKEGNIQTIYKKAVCLDKLNRPDSAINILTPHIFINFDDYVIDSSETHQIADFYINLLKKKYTVKQISNEFKSALKGLTYTRTNDSTYMHVNQEWKTIRIDCYFHFLGKKIDIAHSGGFGVKDFNEETPIGLRKEDILKELRKSLAYQKLSKL